MNKDPFSSLNFPEPLITKDLLSIANFFKSSESRCGIYLFSLPDDLFYIGQSLDVVKRFVQHKKNHPIIHSFSFLPTYRCDLDKVEQEKISEAQKKGILLANKEYVQDIIGETDFDLLVSKYEQDAWLDQKNYDNKDSIRIDDILHRKRFIPEFNRFLNNPMHEEVIHLFKKYVSRCVPYPKRTEFSFWSVSCCPTTNQNTFPRLVCVNMNMMETFVIGYEKENINDFWAFINVSKSEFEKCRKKIVNRFNPDIFLNRRNYKCAAGDSLTIHASLNTMDHLLEKKEILEASRILNLRLMRKGATVLYSRYHCFQLADCIFENKR